MHLKKRRGLDEADRKIVRLRNSAGRLNIEKGLIGGAPVKERSKAAIFDDARAKEREVPAEPRFEPTRRKLNDIIRREDYADVYQIGRRVSSTQKLMPKGKPRKGESAGVNASAPRSRRDFGSPFGRVPLAQQNARECPAGTGAPAVQSAAAPVVRQKKKFNTRKLIAAAACAMLLTAATLGVFSIAQPHPALAQGQEVFYDGRMLGIVQSRGDVEKALQQIRADLKNTYGMEVQQSGELTFSPVLCDSQNIVGTADIANALKNNIDVKVMASVITVNDRPAVALRSAGEAQQALDAVLAPYRNAPASRYRTDIAFVENVQVKEMPIDYSLVQPVEAAVHSLTLGAGVEDNPYTVEKGDTLLKIAKKFDLKSTDIRRANPALSNADVLRPGQELNAVKPENWVNIRYTEQVERQETLPFNTVEQTSDTLYTTQTDVKQEGKNGQRSVWAKITFINGMEAQEEVLSQTVVTPAQDKIVLKGTKKVPTNSGGGTAVSGNYISPLRQYTITSRFGTRTLNGQKDTHYGIDMAAPKGTPIYATRSGTVSYSGSASGYGLVVYLDHGGGVQTRYGHCSKLLVKKGQTVKQGQIIALVGSTGHSTGPHCHFEMRVNGTPVNPAKYVKL